VTHNDMPATAVSFEESSSSSSSLGCPLMKQRSQATGRDSPRLQRLCRFEVCAFTLWAPGLLTPGPGQHTAARFALAAMPAGQDKVPLRLSTQTANCYHTPDCRILMAVLVTEKSLPLGTALVFATCNGQGTHARGAGKVYVHAIGHGSSYAVERAPFWVGKGATLAGIGKAPTAHATDTLQGCRPSAASLEAGRAVLQVPQHEGGVPDLQQCSPYSTASGPRQWQR